MSSLPDQAPRTRTRAVCGNGSAMRACALGELYKKDWTKRRVEREAIASAMVTHNHPEGVKGAKVIAVCTWMLERGKGKEAVLKYASEQYPVSQYMYGCGVSTDSYAKTMRFHCSCQNTVPVAIRAFYDTNNFDECMRLAIDIGFNVQQRSIDICLLWRTMDTFATCDVCYILFFAF